MQNVPYVGTMTAVDEYELIFASMTSDTALTKVHEDTDDVLHIAKE